MIRKLKSILKSYFPSLYLLILKMRYYFKGLEPRNQLFTNFAKDIILYKNEKNVSLEEITSIFSDDFSRVNYLAYLEQMQKYLDKQVFKFRELYSIEDYMKLGRAEIELQKIIRRFNFSFPEYEYVVFVYKHGYDDLPDLIKKYIVGKDIIDAGAFIGDSAFIFESFYNPNKIYAFEPDLSNFQTLEKNIELYRLQKTKPIRKGLGKDNCLLNISNEGNSSKLTLDAKNSTVEIVRLDDFIQSNQVHLGVIKADVEGFGLELIQGSIESIKKFRPVLLISIYHSGKEYFEIPRLLSKTLDNYEFIIRKYHPLYQFMEINLIAYPKEELK